ncbi:ankyrin repeat domain-containing protein [Oculatella sp. LEGE 06141]|uniref:ankyrin repeat domain-containing protein n=1 Tax=Oculatella sp. LEGE 06141 TaxID=1828648 RepID=UPI001882E0D7|nr:ankyrin repeat domain-containing protein [Oculatella sp. LEGE 06141]MBE9178150.1 ankyrin repeat domain-containing protein [Oculatella sp. LEGE 06141]
MNSFFEGIKSLLSLAARSGSRQVVEMLISSGADVNSLDESGKAPIHWAARGGYLDVMRCLAENGANLNLCSKDSYLALHYAIQCQNPEIVEFLLKKEVLVDEYASVMLGRIDQIRAFINIGFNVNETYTKLNTYPIFDAIEFQHLNVVRLLIQVGASVHNVLDSNGATVLHLHGSVKNIHIFNSLISAGANIYLRDYKGFTPLHVAARSGCSNVVARLVELGADIDSIAEDGSTPLWQAAYSQNQQATECLLSAGARVNISNRLGETPLHATLHRKSGVLVAQSLIDRGIDINSTNQRGLRAIHIAVAQGNEELVDLLLTNNATIY